MIFSGSLRRAMWLSTMMMICLTLSMRTMAQTTTADFSGVVTNTAGSAVANAPVSIENLNTHEVRKASTLANGQFTILAVTPGNYSLLIAAKGYKGYSINPFTLTAGDKMSLVAAMQPGSSSEVVTVSAQAIHQTANRSGAALTGKAVQDVPQNERNYVNVVQTAAGTGGGTMDQAASSTTSQPGAQHNSSSVSVNGQPDLLNNHMLDGLDNNERYNGYSLIHPSVDGIAAVQVKSSAYPADIGRSGSGVINIVTKSGTNKYHGSVFEFFRNDILDAYPFQFGASNRKQELRQNQAGGSIGGPIKKNKIFFYGDYEGYFLVQGRNPSKLAVPTLYEEQNIGDFSDVGGGMVTSVDPVAAQYFKLFPAPTVTTSTGAYYVGGQAGKNTTHELDTRIDAKLTPRMNMFGRYNFNKITMYIPGVFPTTTVAGVSVQPGGLLNTYPSNISRDGSSVALGLDYSITPRWLLHLAGEFGNWWQVGNPIDYGTNVNAAFGQPHINIDAKTSGLAPIYIASYGTYLGNAGYFKPLYQNNNAFDYLGTLGWSYKEHSIKFGAAIIRRQLTATQDTNGLGNWTFLSPENFLAGNYATAQRSNQLADPHYRMWEPSVFVSDDWRVSKTLTVNVGVRWDIYTPFTEIRNEIANFDIHSGEFLIAGKDGVGATAGIATQHVNVSPRFGFIYDLGHNMTLRGGFGFGYFPPNNSSTAALANQPYVDSVGPFSPSGAPAGYSAFQNGLPEPSTPDMSNPTGTIPEAMDTNWHVSYAEQFNLLLQKDFHGTTVTAAYVGALGRHVERQYPDFNAPTPNTLSTTAANTLRPFYDKYPNITVIKGIASNGNSSYHSLQAIVERHFKNGLGFNFNNTWSHALDDANPSGASGIGSLPNSVGMRITSGGLRYDYGNGDFDVRDRIAATANYQLPFGKNLKGARGVAAKGWQANMMMVWATGLPFTVTNASNVSGTNPGSSNTDRPNVVGKMTVSKPGVAEFFNTSAFVAQKPGTIGVLSSDTGSSVYGSNWEQRNALHGPHQRHLDVSLFKTLPVTKGSNVQFRVECFNVTNTANFAAPNSSLGGKAFGELTQMTAGYTPREIQFALKYQF
jgi:hypothetical protein